MYMMAIVLTFLSTGDVKLYYHANPEAYRTKEACEFFIPRPPVEDEEYRAEIKCFKIGMNDD